MGDMTNPLEDFPKIHRWSERVSSVLGLNPNVFTGPGTNTFLIGSGRKRILLDTGQNSEGYLQLLEDAVESEGCEIEAIAVTHGHIDHVGGIEAIRERFGAVPVYMWTRAQGQQAGKGPADALHLADGECLEVEGAKLRALYTPGHAEDHLCFFLEEEQAIFTGDNVLGEGIGTTIILMEGGDLEAYLDSLQRMLGETPAALYPGHGARIQKASACIREIVEHRLLRDRQILSGLEVGRASISALVERIYTETPKFLYPAAAQSVGSHLLKLEREARVVRVEPGADPLETDWQLGS
ncbi:MAG: beta-lactamase-like protein 2 [Deltaproteobacteria bacterium]|nr:beta-lactamase-like protein 2 [Deltaproteobacteria bacterium]